MALWPKESFLQNKEVKRAIGTLVLKSRMRDLERSLTRQPHRNDIKLDILKLRNQLKQLKGTGHGRQQNAVGVSSNR